VPCAGLLVASTPPPWARTSSATTARPIPLPVTPAACRPAPEPIENTRQFVRGDAGAGVGHAEPCLLAGLPGLQRYLPAGRGELQRIAEQVGDDLMHPPGIR
jgi:hypothetical protein